MFQKYGCFKLRKNAFPSTGRNCIFAARFFYSQNLFKSQTKQPAKSIDLAGYLKIYIQIYIHFTSKNSPKYFKITPISSSDFGDENLEITKSRLVSFENRMKQFPSINLSIIYCKSADQVKEKLELILDDDSIDGFFAMSDETLMGLHSSLIKRSLNNTNKKVVSISEGTLPKYLDETYEYQINDGYEMGTFAATQLLKSIKNEAPETHEDDTAKHKI